MSTAPLYHRAHLVTEMGEVSALCFKWPKPIDLTRARWTIRPEAVTCPRCRALQQHSSATKEGTALCP